MSEHIFSPVFKSARPAFLFQPSFFFFFFCGLGTKGLANGMFQPAFGNVPHLSADQNIQHASTLEDVLSRVVQIEIIEDYLKL